MPCVPARELTAKMAYTCILGAQVVRQRVVFVQICLKSAPLVSEN